MKMIVELFTAATLVGLASSAVAQHGRGRAPPGFFRESCRDIRMEGSVLHALCRRARGRGEQRTALNIAHCIGDTPNAVARSDERNRGSADSGHSPMLA